MYIVTHHCTIVGNSGKNRGNLPGNPSSQKIQQIIQRELENNLNRLVQPELRQMREPLAMIVNQIFGVLQNSGVSDLSIPSSNNEELSRLRYQVSLKLYRTI